MGVSERIDSSVTATIDKARNEMLAENDSFIAALALIRADSVLATLGKTRTPIMIDTGQRSRYPRDTMAKFLPLSRPAVLPH